MEFRKHFDYDVEAASREAVVLNIDPSMTVQEMSEDADINVVMERFGRTGVMPSTVVLPTYDDFSNVVDYQSALNALIDAGQKFMELPAQLRAKFDNDPQKYLEFCSDEKNADEMEKLGLLSVDAVKRRGAERMKLDEERNKAALAAKAPVST